MIPEELKAMARSYPGSPITTAAIEKAYGRRLPNMTFTPEGLLQMLEVWETETPFVVKSKAASSPASRRAAYFSSDDLEFDGTCVTARFRGSASIVWDATVRGSANTYGSLYFDVSNLDDSYDCLEDLIDALESELDDYPDMEVDWDTAEHDANEDCTTVGDSDIDDMGDSDREFGSSDIRALAEHLVEHGYITIGANDDDDDDDE